ncbi:MAG: phosphoribosylformylglycinamidine synthase subunit PurL [Oligoflexus sp.]
MARDKLESDTELLKTHKISPTEYQTILKILGRLPTMAELGIFSAMWSEHCSYKSSRVHLKRLPTEGEQVVVGPGENAGIVRLSGKLCAAFKMESHNHPSYIEPYQGAATGVGGILRDVFCMGARPVANLNCLRFGRREHPRTHYLFENVVKGIGDYGNCVGIPTVAGNVSFHASYDGNCLVNAMTVGLIHEDRIFKGYASGTGNLVIYVGSATGRDGIHGATMASDSFDSSEGSSSRTTVQVGDPFAEKLLLEATLELLDKDLVIGLQDMGAAGLTSSSFEMADRAGSGLYLDLDRVPVRAQNMSAYELLLSESQERMLLVVAPEKWPEIEACLNRWELAFNVIGVVTDSGRVQIGYHGQLEVDVPVAPLAGMAPVYDRPRQPHTLLAEQEPQLRQSLLEKLHALGTTKALEKLLQETGAKDVIYQQYDHHIGTSTVFGPEAQGAGLLWLRSEWSKDEPYLGLAVAASCNERYCGVNPFLGGAHAVLKSARAITATGALPLAVTDCLNFGNPEVPEVMEEFAQAVDGIGEACRELNTPVVSGNVSLYNTTDGNSILPTPMIGMVGKHNDIRQATPASLQGSDGLVALLAPKNPSFTFGGSLLGHVLGDSSREGQAPSINWPLERQAMTNILDWIAAGKVKAARDVADGGILTCLIKMCLGGAGGVQGQLAAGKSQDEAHCWYFGELGPAYVLQFTSLNQYEQALQSLPQDSDLCLYQIGKCHSDRTVAIDGLDISLDQLQQAFENSLRF